MVGLWSICSYHMLHSRFLFFIETEEVVAVEDFLQLSPSCVQFFTSPQWIEGVSLVLGAAPGDFLYLPLSLALLGGRYIVQTIFLFPTSNSKVTFGGLFLCLVFCVLFLFELQLLSLPCFFDQEGFLYRICILFLDYIIYRKVEIYS